MYAHIARWNFSRFEICHFDKTLRYTHCTLKGRYYLLERSQRYLLQYIYIHISLFANIYFSFVCLMKMSLFLKDHVRRYLYTNYLDKGIIFSFGNYCTYTHMFVVKLNFSLMLVSNYFVVVSFYFLEH